MRKTRHGYRYTVYIYEGENMVMTDLIKIKGISSCAFRNRIKNGWTVKDAVETPPYKLPSRG